VLEPKRTTLDAPAHVVFAVSRIAAASASFDKYRRSDVDVAISTDRARACAVVAVKPLRTKPV
jgi:hypothetical protein